ncbi:MAG: Thioredoxin [Candidatus Lokiarchaeum sp. GC14_75]|nr:MAG: Thioredoxin [Candidatus Lokiarchaeum sp. GC14_75]
MSDHELERIRLRKAEMLLKQKSTPKGIIKIQDENEFNKLLTDFPEKIVIIDFWAVWCGPCKIFAPVFEKLHQEYQHEFLFVKVNVDDNPNIALKFGVSSIPTTMFLKGGILLKSIVGSINYTALKPILEQFKL